MAVARSYRPSGLIRLYVRLEDFTDDTQETATEAKPYTAKASHLQIDIDDLTAMQAQARAAGDGASAEALGREIKKQQRTLKKVSTTTPKSRPQQEAPGDDFSINFVTVPLESSTELNSFRIADTATLTFPFRDAPLVSDIIRAALVEVFLGTISEEDFAQPLRWRLPPTRANLVFRGYVDTWDTNHGDDDATVQIQARSLEAVLIDAKINPLAPDYRIKGDGEKISVYINRILSKLPATAGLKTGDQLKARWFGSPADDEPLLDRKKLLRTLQTAKSRNKAMGAADGAIPPVQGEQDQGGTPPGEIIGSGDSRLPPANPGQESSVWDLITQAGQLAGCLPTYDPSLDPDAIILRPPQTIYEDVNSGLSIPGGAIDGFKRSFTNPQNGTVMESDVRFLVWGHNIKSLKTSRKLGRIKAPTIEVISFNKDAPAGQRTIAVRYPPEDSKRRATRVGAKGEGKTEEVKTINIRGVRDRKQLEQIAVGLYHSLGRQEVSVKLETDDLASYIDPRNPLSHNDNPDVLKLRPGTPVRVTVAREVNDPAGQIILSPLSEVFEKRTDELVRLLREQRGRFQPTLDAVDGLLLDEQTAHKLGRALQSAKLTDLFYVRTITHKFSAGEGWSAEMELTNFIEARSLPKNISIRARELDEALKNQKKLTQDTADLKAAVQKRKAEARVDRARKGF